MMCCTDIRPGQSSYCGFSEVLKIGLEGNTQKGGGKPEKAS